MEPPVIAEILDRFGKVRDRIRVDQFPFRIGRGYHNDIILDDPYVSPRHAEIVVDGNNNIMINDLGSDNGLYTTHPMQRQDSFLIQDNQRIRVGHTEIRFRSPKFPVKQTVKLQRAATEGIWLGRMFALPLAWSAFCALLLWYTYLESTNEVTFGQILGSALPLLLALPLWAFLWSMVSKIVTHRFYFVYHAVWSSLIVISMYLIGSVNEYLEFIIGLSGLSDYLTIVSDLVLVTIIFYGHLRYSTTYVPRRAAIISTVTACVLIFVIELSHFLSQLEFSAQPQFSDIVKPPQYVLRQPKSIDGFFAAGDSLTEFDDVELPQPSTP